MLSNYVSVFHYNRLAYSRTDIWQWALWMLQYCVYCVPSTVQWVWHISSYNLLHCLVSPAKSNSWTAVGLLLLYIHVYIRRVPGVAIIRPLDV